MIDAKINILIYFLKLFLTSVECCLCAGIPHHIYNLILVNDNVVINLVVSYKTGENKEYYKVTDVWEGPSILLGCRVRQCFYAKDWILSLLHDPKH